MSDSSDLTVLNVLLTQRDWIGLFIATLDLFGSVVAGRFVDGTLAIGFALALGTVIVLFVLLQNCREVLQNRQQSELLFEQTEALFGLYFSLSGMLPRAG